MPDDFVAGPGADERLSEWRGRRNLSARYVDFRFTDDRKRAISPAGAAHGDDGAEAHDRRVARRFGNDRRVDLGLKRLALRLILGCGQPRTKRFESFRRHERRMLGEDFRLGSILVLLHEGAAHSL